LDVRVHRIPEDRDAERDRYDQPHPGERCDHPAPDLRSLDEIDGNRQENRKRDECEEQPDPDRDSLGRLGYITPKAPPHERLGQLVESEEERERGRGICFGEATWRRASTPTTTMIAPATTSASGAKHMAFPWFPSVRP
jgi:hypothetical protein